MFRRLTSRFKQKFRRVAEIRKSFGTRAVLQWAASMAAYRIIKLEVTNIVWLELARLNLPGQPDPEFTFRFLTPDEVRDFSHDPRNLICEERIAGAETGRHLCFAALDGDRLAAYGWYALDPTGIDQNYGIALAYPSDVACMYDGFTHPDYRGKRLHGFCMGYALQGLTAYGVDKLVSTVQWCNWPSLRSCWRLGYIDLGRAATYGPGNRKFAHIPKMARDFGVLVGPEAERIIENSARASRPQSTTRSEEALVSMSC